MNPNKPTHIYFLFMLLLMILLGCRLFQGGTSSTSPTLPPTMISTSPLPATPTASQPPTIAPTDLSPSSIPGIDEPIIIKGVSYKDSMGLTVKENVKMQILDALTEESKKSGDSGPIYPENRSDVFLTLKFNPMLNVNALDWVATNAEFKCDGRAHEAETVGIKVGNDGRLEALLITYVVPGDENFSECKLELPDGQLISLTPFFE